MINLPMRVQRRKGLLFHAVASVRAMLFGLVFCHDLAHFAALLRWGHSSAGRARQWHCRGQGFDPPWLHHFNHNHHRILFKPGYYCGHNQIELSRVFLLLWIKSGAYQTPDFSNHFTLLIRRDLCTRIINSDQKRFFASWPYDGNVIRRSIFS